MIKDFRVIHILDTTMEMTDQRVAVIELSEIKYQTEIGNFAPYLFEPKGQRFVIDFSSTITNTIINLARNEEIIKLNLNEFRKQPEYKEGKLEDIYYHKNVRVIGLDDELSTREINFELFCKNCKTERSYTTPITFPIDTYLSLNFFKEILLEVDASCVWCDQKGKAGEMNKFQLVKTNGLDEDLIPNLTNYEKRDWYGGLDFVFQHYLKEIFKINEYAQIGFSLDFYECRFILKKRHVFTIENVQYSIYLIEAIVLNNGNSHKVKDNFPFIYKYDIEQHVKEEFTINPNRFTAKEQRFNLGGQTHYIPVLEIKK